MSSFEYKEKTCIKMDSEDPLWLERFLFSGLFKYKLVRMLLILDIILTLVKYIVQIYYFKNNLSYFVHYGMLFFGEPYAIAAGVANLWKWDVVEEIYNRCNYWTYDSAGEETRKKLEKSVKIHTVVVTSAILSVVLASINCFVPNTNDKHFFFPVFLFEQWWPEKAWIFTLAFKLTLVPLGYSAMVQPLLMMYGVQHMFNQNVMLIELYKNADRGYEEGEEQHLLYDRQFQEVVHKRLCFCIKRQIEGVMEMNVKLIRPLFAVFTFFAYCIGIGIIMFYWAAKAGFYDFTFKNMLFPINMVINSIMLFIGLIIAGQQSEDIGEMIPASVNHLEWYRLDRKNTRTMQIIMINNESRALRFSEKTRINYDFGVRVVKGIYSLTSVLATSERLQ